MQAYRYDENYIYAGEITCQLDPRESQKTGHDVYLIPANSTTVEPPEEKEGFLIVWNGSAWEYQEIPAPPEPHEPTKEEKIAELDANYASQKSVLCEQYTDAQIHGDTETAAAIVDEMSDLDAWYDTEYQKIINEEGE